MKDNAESKDKKIVVMEASIKNDNLNINSRLHQVTNSLLTKKSTIQISTRYTGA
jgi:predicted aldo/keto reductase-like oxidoreductase